jgi:hypothetical protein
LKNIKHLQYNSTNSRKKTLSQTTNNFSTKNQKHRGHTKLKDDGLKKVGPLFQKTEKNLTTKPATCVYSNNSKALSHPKEDYSDDPKCGFSSNRDHTSKGVLEKNLPVNTFRQKKQGSWSISLGSNLHTRYLKSSLTKDDSVIAILAKKVKELEKTLKESTTKIKMLQRKNNVLTEKLSKIDDCRTG